MSVYTRQIVSKRAGEGGLKRGGSMRRLQQLLILCDCLAAGADDGKWGKNTRAALLKFQKTRKIPQRPFVEPVDECLMRLAFKGGVGLRLVQQNGSTGFTKLHDSIKGTPFYMGSVVDTLKGWNGAVFMYTENGLHFETQYAGRLFNCTTYANLMMATWKWPYSGGARFNPNVAKSGGRIRFATSRYFYPICKTKKGREVFRSTEEIEAVVGKRNKRLYCLEQMSGDKVFHMALLYNGNVYEASASKGKVRSVALKTWMTEFNRKTWLSGPSPTT